VRCASDADKSSEGCVSVSRKPLMLFVNDCMAVGPENSGQSCEHSQTSALYFALSCVTILTNPVEQWYRAGEPRQNEHHARHHVCMPKCHAEDTSILKGVDSQRYSHVTHHDCSLITRNTA